ncbi:exonuclease domain-containing protein [Rheinheimera pacifica]|uniref:exonuclease domain-containing protein n=1 Tax=Rheinheimera pacifica TaxID=173990 RepID=UPI0039C9C0FF
MPSHRDRLAFNTNRVRAKLNSGLQSYSLGKLCKEFDIKFTCHHRALDDVTVTLELLKLINARRCRPELAKK